jgi:putative flippase GtrA
VRLMRILPERWQRLVPEMTKFAVIGAINTAVDIAILNALLWIGPLKAKIVSTVVATTLSYLMNRRWTFASRQRGKVHREYLLFFGLNAIGWIIQMAPIGFAKYGLGFSEESLELADWIAFNLANLIGTFFGMLFRFWSYRTFVFKKPDASTVPLAATTAGAGPEPGALESRPALLVPDVPRAELGLAELPAPADSSAAGTAPSPRGTFSG